MANHARYLDPATGLFSKKFTEERNCPACDSQHSREAFQKSGGVYVVCSDCKMVFLNPVFKDEYIEDYYRNNHQVQGEIVAADNAFYSGLYNSGLTLISSHVARPGKILDVGCSSGSFLDIAKQRHWECHGLELNAGEAKQARAKGHTVQECLISAATFDERFDAISLWDVYEHIKDGAEFLRQCRKLLNKDGVVFLQSPSSDSLAAKILQANCNMFDGLEHVNLFGQKSLSRICAAADFELCDYRTVIAEIGVVNNYLEYDDPYLGFALNKTSIMGLIDEQAICEKNLGYKFQACLKMK